MDTSQVVRLAKAVIDVSADNDLSNAVDIAGASTVAVLMPSSWTAADLTLYAAEKEDGTFRAVTDVAGTAIAIKVAADKAVPLAAAAPFRWIKLGTSVGQDADREFILVLKG